MPSELEDPELGISSLNIKHRKTWMSKCSPRSSIVEKLI